MSIFVKFLIFFVPTYILMMLFVSINYKEGRFSFDFKGEEIFVWALFMASFSLLMSFEKKKSEIEGYQEAFDDTIEILKASKESES